MEDIKMAFWVGYMAGLATIVLALSVMSHG